MLGAASDTLKECGLLDSIYPVGNTWSPHLLPATHLQREKVQITKKCFQKVISFISGPFQRKSSFLTRKQDSVCSTQSCKKI